MAEQQGTEGQGTETQGQGAERTFTQAEVNEMMGKVRRETRAKFSDYDDLKAKAGEYDQLQEASKTELQKAQERAERAERELSDARAARERAELVGRVSTETGVPAGLLHGTTEDELTESAKAISEWARAAAYPQDKGGAGNPAPATKEAILAIKDKAEQRRQIALHHDLFR